MEMTADTILESLRRNEQEEKQIEKIVSNKGDELFLRYVGKSGIRDALLILAFTVNHLKQEHKEVQSGNGELDFEVDDGTMIINSPGHEFYRDSVIADSFEDIISIAEWMDFLIQETAEDAQLIENINKTERTFTNITDKGTTNERVNRYIMRLEEIIKMVTHYTGTAEDYKNRLLNGERWGAGVAE